MNQLSTIVRSVGVGTLLAIGAVGLPAAEPDAGAPAERSAFSLGFEGGTTGFGPVLQYTPSERFNFALSYNYFDFDAKNLKTDRARYDTDLRMSSLAATVDWHPWRNGFHFTCGAVVYNHRFDVTARPRRGTVYEIGKHDYTNTEITSLTGRVDTDTQIAPYLGVGWTWHFGRNGFSLMTNLGVMFTDDYDAHLTATGPMASDPTFLEDLRREEKDINDNNEVYPVAKVGFAYRF